MPCEFSYNETANLVIVDVEYWEQVFTAVIIAFIALVGLFGNSLIIVAVSFSRQLQTATNAFVTNLAVADLFTSFVLIWYAVGALGKGGWPIPGACWICEATGLSILASIGTSTSNLAAIAVNRLIRIRFSNQYRKIFTTWKLVLFIALTWFIPIGLLTFVFAAGYGVVGYSPRNHICGSWNKDDYQILTLTEFVSVFVPGFLIFGCYIWIHIFVKRHFKLQKKNLPAVSFRIETGSKHSNVSMVSGDTESTDIEKMSCESHGKIKEKSHHDKLCRQQIKITKNLFLIVCAFFACFLPYFILAFFKLHSVGDRMRFYVKTMPLANCCINFFIYARKHPDFKIVVCHLLKRTYADIPQPSGLLKFLLSKNN